jgi:tetratricopeptide (TPR) repeat protein
MRRIAVFPPALCLLALALLGCARTPQPAPQPSAKPAVASNATVAAQSPPSTMHMPMSLADWANGAMLFQDLGNFHRQVTTSSAQAQQYFDQGMRLLWAFNHDESTRSFAKAAQLDPLCAMCYWGVALTVGPNYNVPVMAEPRAHVAWAALQEAQKRALHSTPVEQALIGALSKRYQGPKALDPSNSAPVLAAYAQAMSEVARQFSDDLDVQTLSAEALMNVNAWRLWTADGKPAPGTPQIVAKLEYVLKRDPQHPGANHYYVHAMEESPHPQKALAAAERLHGMMPAAGHLVHMPAHILQQVGRYEEAAEANRQGASADRAYFALTKPLDYYSMYLGHNYQFLAYSTAMEGRRAETLEATRLSREAVSDEMLLAMPGVDWSLAERYHAMIRFGLWDEILAEPAPDPRLIALTGGYLYARGVAQAAKGQLAQVKTTLAQLQRFAAALPAHASAGFNSATDVFALAQLLVRARIAQAENDRDAVVALLREAVAKEDQLAYDEPADWFFPVRHLLGAQLLIAGKAGEAESVYREDLKRHPNNGWSLFGLAQTLRAQKKTAEAAKVQAQFKVAWKHADVTLAASAL